MAANDDLAARVQTDGATGRWVRALLGEVRALGDGTAFRDARGADGGCRSDSSGAGPLRRRAELIEIRRSGPRRAIAIGRTYRHGRRIGKTRDGRCGAP